jgi:hypothetical protein
MVDKKKEVLTAEAENPFSDPLYNMIRLVGEERISLQEATTSLRAYLLSLSIEEQKTWKENAVARARRLMMVAEAFSQELTVMGAGQ